MIVGGKMIDFTLEDIINYRDIWIDALLNGEFTQARKVLATPNYNAFCCLGVAEDAVGPRLPDDCKIVRTQDGDFGIKNPRWPVSPLEYDSVSSKLHPQLRFALGLSESQESILVAMNDNLDVDFDGIAKIVMLMDIHLNGRMYDCYGNSTN